MDQKFTSETLMGGEGAMQFPDLFSVESSITILSQWRAGRDLLKSRVLELKTLVWYLLTSEKAKAT